MSLHSHDTPLVVFTALAIAGAGTIVASALAGLAGWEPAPLAPWVGTAMLAAGILVSLTHLGRMWRAPQAARGLGRSRVSNEVALAAAVLFFAVSLATGARGSSLGLVITLGTVVLGVAFLVSLGLVYSLGGQSTWRGAAILTPLTSGLAVGALTTSVLAPPLRGAGAGPALVLLGLDALVFVVRWAALPGPALAPGTRRLRLVARLALLDAVPIALVASGQPIYALASAALGLVVDRIGFYAMAVQHTTEVEIDRVERVLANTPGPAGS